MRFSPLQERSYTIAPHITFSYSTTSNPSFSPPVTLYFSRNNICSHSLISPLTLIFNDIFTDGSYHFTGCCHLTLTFVTINRFPRYSTSYSNHTISLAGCFKAILAHLIKLRFFSIPPSHGD